MAGVLLLAFPIEGILTLTLFLALFFILTGVIRAIMALDSRGAGWGWMLASGIVAVALGVVILIGYPQAAGWILGLLLGIDFVFFGAMLIALVLAARRGDLPRQIRDMSAES